MEVLTCLNVKIREIFLQGNPLYFVAVGTVFAVEMALENRAMIKKNKYILEDQYCFCNVDLF